MPGRSVVSFLLGISALLCLVALVIERPQTFQSPANVLAPVERVIEGEAYAGTPAVACGGDCATHCDELCARCTAQGAPQSAISHFCSPDGIGFKVCRGILEKENDRCHDRVWLSACGAPKCEGGSSSSPSRPVTFTFTNHSNQKLYGYFAVTAASPMDCKNLGGPVELLANANWSSVVPEGQHGWYRFQTTNQGGCDSRFNKFESHTQWDSSRAGQTVPINVQ